MNGLLASGRTADVYSHGDGVVLKLFRRGVTLQHIESERHNASVAHSMGIPTPAVGDVVYRGERIGLTFERVDGVPMMERLLADPDSVEPLARLLAELHARLHRMKPPDGLPTQGEMVRERISRCKLLSEPDRNKLLSALADLQSVESFCHGDFHPGNVMLTDGGPMIIDCIDASRGNPIGDVARTSLLILGHIANDQVEPDRLAAMKLFHDTYIDRYMESNSSAWPVYRRWIPILAAARLQEGIQEQEKWLIGQALAGLAPR